MDTNNSPAIAGHDLIVSPPWLGCGVHSTTKNDIYTRTFQRARLRTYARSGQGSDSVSPMFRNCCRIPRRVVSAAGLEPATHALKGVPARRVNNLAAHE